MLFLRWYLWIAPNVLLILCAFGLFRRAAHKTQPLFAYLVVFQPASFLSLFATALLVHHGAISLNGYRWVMVILTAITNMLQLTVLNEIANVLLFSRSSLAHLDRMVLRGTIAALLLVSAGLSALLRPNGLERVMAIFQILDFASSLLSVGLLLSLLLFSRALHISWRGLPAGLALGFGIDASTELSAAALFSVFGRPGYIPLDILRQSAFHVCVVIWLIYIFLPTKPPSFSGRWPDRADLEAWDQELQKMVH